MISAHPSGGGATVFSARLRALVFAAACASVCAPASARTIAAEKRVSVVVGPYLQHVDEDSIWILWRQSRASGAEVRYRVYGSDSPYRLVAVGDTGSAKRVELENLEPATRYEYGVRAKGGRWHRGSFRTAVSGSDPFTFLVIGDTRLGERDAHRALVEAMLLEDAAFVINTGDMVAGADEQRWAHFFETERDLLSRVVLYPAMGNHELAGGRARGRRLFKEMFNTPRNGPDPGIVYSFVHGNAKIIFIDTNSDFIGTDQSSWAKGEMLRASADPDTRHIFLVAHHGPYSSGPHGPNRRLAESGLLDVSRRCGVDIIFSGHDHLYERGEVDGLRYVVSGGGGAPPYQVERAQPYSRVVDVSHHYVRVTVDGDEVEVVARRTDGSVIDGFGYVKSAEAAAGKNRFTVIHDRHPALDGRRLAGMIAAAAELSSAGAEVFSGSIAVRWLLVGAAVVVGLALLWLLLGRSSAEEL